MTDSKITTRPDWNQAWQNQFNDLKRFMSENDGSVPYPRPGQDPKIERIGQWVIKQRKAYNAGRLAEDRYELLKDIKGVLIPNSLLKLGERLPGFVRADDAKRAASDALRNVEGTLTVETAVSAVDSAIDGIAVEK